MAYYIQMKSFFGLETVDEFETRKEANKMVSEYRMADHSAYYYVSSRSCREWKQ